MKKILMSASAISILAGFSGVALADNVERSQSQVEGRLQSSLIISPPELSSRADAALVDESCRSDLSFADIMASPDDVDLNVCYARQQISEENIRGAASTLERILILAPDAYAVRYLYAIVLFRLDSPEEAREQFDLVLNQDIPDDVRSEAYGYLAAIDDRLKTTRHRVTLNLGTYYDTNRNGAPKSEELMSLGSRSPIAADKDRRIDAVGQTGTLSYDIIHDIGSQEGHTVFAGADIFADYVNEIPSSRLDGFALDAGFTYQAGEYSLTPRVFFQNMRLHRDKFYQSEGVELRADTQFFEGSPFMIDAWTKGSVRNEDYSNTKDVSTMYLRSGRKYNFEAGVGFDATEKSRFTLAARTERKEAKADPGNGGAETFASRYHEIELSHTYLFENGHFMTSSVAAGVRQFGSPDRLVTGSNPIERRENPYRVGILYGIPAADLFSVDSSIKDEDSVEKANEIIQDTLITFSADYNYTSSNITNYESEGARFGVNLIHRFDF